MYPKNEAGEGIEGRKFASKSLASLLEWGREWETNTWTYRVEFRYLSHRHEIPSTYAYVTTQYDTVPRIQTW